MKKANGFTLIELMVTIAIAAILLGVGVPSFTNMIVGNRLATQTNELIAAVTYARSEAIKRNRTVNMCRATTANATACAGAAGTWEHWVVLAGGTVIRSGSINRFGNTLSVTSGLAGDRVTFTADGLPQAGGVITVCATNGPTENRRIITLGPGNRLSSERASGACP